MGIGMRKIFILIPSATILGFLGACTGHRESDEWARVNVSIERRPQGEYAAKSISDAGGNACYMVHAYSLNGDSRLDRASFLSTSPGETLSFFGPKRLGLVEGLYKFGDTVSLEVPAVGAVKVDLIALSIANNGIVSGANCSEKVSAISHVDANGMPRVNLYPAYDSDMRVMASGVAVLQSGKEVNLSLKETPLVSGLAYPGGYPKYDSHSRVYPVSPALEGGKLYLPVDLTSGSGFIAKCPVGAYQVKIYGAYSINALIGTCNSGQATSFSGGSISTPTSNVINTEPVLWKFVAESSGGTELATFFAPVYRR